MRIVINDEPQVISAPLTVQDLLIALSRSQPGTALAVNHRILPRDRWDSHHLQEGDELVIFQAIAGG